MPLLRYRTRDIASILDENLCECCRSRTKISWILGRTEDIESVAEKLGNQRINVQCAYEFAMGETYLMLKANDVTRTSPGRIRLSTSYSGILRRLSSPRSFSVTEIECL